MLSNTVFNELGGMKQAKVLNDWPRVGHRTVLNFVNELRKRTSLVGLGSVLQKGESGGRNQRDHAD
ncbi:hypothetical protein RRSWK_05768 [Rhodopirellula sp. SWK7]|nr:hypothetical protein RRSWK_05768 [Rhodopirellula sp. SWK7]